MVMVEANVPAAVRGMTAFNAASATSAEKISVINQLVAILV